MRVWYCREVEAGCLLISELGIKYEYACIYGMSFDVPNTQLGVQLSRLDDGVSIHTFTGKQSKLFWFIIIKTDQGNCADKVRYSTQTARDVCDRLRSKALTDNLTFGDVWSGCTIFKMTPLQEGVFKHWNYGRLVCIGDAVRKVSLLASITTRFLTNEGR
jgi:FAD dependent monooxygenase